MRTSRRFYRWARGDGFGLFRLGFDRIRVMHGVGEREKREKERGGREGPVRGCWAGPGPAAGLARVAAALFLTKHFLFSFFSDFKTKN